MIIKCKMCGGDMVVSLDQKTGTCEYCGSTMTIPKVDDEQRAAAFNRGNHFRRIGEFDKALSVYESIVREDEADAEAHWCCALCRFGIEYVKDPASEEYIPTCHRASFDSFLEDVDYQEALKYADVVARAQYQKDAEKIAQVQRGILSISQKEQPFDVFICYKESDENGNRTVDSTLAQEIYYQLTEQGRRVFFARITLEDKAGQEYEPYIFAALHSAKVMVVVGTKPEYLNAVWVKNEWSRYLALMKHDRKRLLIPCYRDMDPYDLPEQLSVLQSYDMSKIGFIQDLIRGIAKVLDADKKPERTEEKETVIIHGEGGTNLTALLKRGQQALEDEDWEKADGFFDQALNIDAENGEAFFGKAMAGFKCRNRQMFIDHFSVNHEIDPKDLMLPDPNQKLPDRLLIGDEVEACPRDEKRIEQIIAKYELPGYLTKDELLKDFDEGDMRKYISAASIRRFYQADWEKRMKVKNKNLVRAKQYAKGTFAETLLEIYGEIDKILVRRLKEAEERDNEVSEKKKADYENFLDLVEKMAAEKNGLAVAVRDADYLAAQVAEEHAKTQKEFLDAAAQFEKVGNIKDALERVKACRKKAEEAAAETERLRKEKKASDVRTKKHRQKKIAIIAAAVAMITIAAFAVNNKVIQPSLKYKEAEKMLAAGEYDAAAEAFTALGNYSDAADRVSEAENGILEGKYQAAQALMEAGEYAEAYEAFNTMRNYKDVDELLKNNQKLLDAYFAVGNQILFGRYEQDGDLSNGAEEIEWLVLDKEGNKVLLLSKYGLDAKPYNEDGVDITWEQSTIRSWLNGEFMNTAFTSDEQAAILQTEVDNSEAEGKSKYVTNGGNNTEDQVFLLSYKEAFEDYFTGEEMRICIPTAYAVQQGAYESEEGNSGWWLRSPGYTQDEAISVLPGGFSNSEIVEFDVNGQTDCIRPALWINLESDIF